MSLQRGIDLRALAEKMGNCSGAEVKGICTEAGMLSLFLPSVHVLMKDDRTTYRNVRVEGASITCDPDGL